MACNDVNVTVTTSNPVTVKPTINETNVSLGTVLPSTKDVHKKEQFTATASQTTFALAFIPRSNSELVFVNGVLQQQGVSYSRTNANIIFATGLDLDDKVEVNYVVS